MPKAKSGQLDIFVRDVGTGKPMYEVTYGWPGSRKSGSKKLKGKFASFDDAIEATEEIEREHGIR